MLLNHNEVNILSTAKSNNISELSDICGMCSFSDINKTFLKQEIKKENNNLDGSGKLKVKFSNNFTLNTFLAIKKSFHTIFKIVYPEEFFDCVYLKKYHSIIGLEAETRELLCFSHIELDKSKKTAKILTLGVVKEYQNSGIGTQLMKKVKEELFVLGTKSISLIVQDTNNIAKKLYTNFGFKEDKVLENYYSLDDPKENKALQMTLIFESKKTMAIGR